MAMTIREIAQKLHITKQAVSQRIDAIDGFRANHLNKVGNHFEIDDEGFKKLAKFDNNDQQESQEYQQEQQQENQENDYLQKYIDSLVKQVDKKDAQLASRDSEIKDLIKTLDQQQQLQLATTKENTELKQRIKRLEVYPQQPSSAANSATTSASSSSPASSTADSTNDAPSASSSPHRHFWNLFKKR